MWQRKQMTGKSWIFYLHKIPLLSAGRWKSVQLALAEHRQRLDGALDVHAFNRDIDDINDRVNEKVNYSFLIIEYWNSSLVTFSSVVVLPHFAPRF